MNIFVKVTAIFYILKSLIFLVNSSNENGFTFFFNTAGNRDSSNFRINKQMDFQNMMKTSTNNQQKPVVVMVNSQQQQPNDFFSLPRLFPQQTGSRSIPTSVEGESEEEEERNDCELSITTVNGKRACRGKMIFFDDFTNEKDTMNKWTDEIFIPSYSPEQPDGIFNFFDIDECYLKEGKLMFTPVVMDDQFVRRGHLKLDGCTGTYEEECERTARYQWILPPVASARVTTKNSFSFKYGKIEIQARFPKGDWLVPEMWLVPKNNFYGEGLESGRIIMAMARGNQQLNFEDVDLSNRVLESSLLMSSNGKIRSRTMRVKIKQPWRTHYNKYLFTWRPDGYSLSVNGKLIEHLVHDNFTGTLSNMVGFTHEEQRRWLSGSAMAPFDQEFYILLGLSVGGRDFPDDSISGNYRKPWRSRTVKEMLDFYKARVWWENTWQDEARKTFIVNSVKVTAL